MGTFIRPFSDAGSTGWGARAGPPGKHPPALPHSRLEMPLGRAFRKREPGWGAPAALPGGRGTGRSAAGAAGGTPKGTTPLGSGTPAKRGRASPASPPLRPVPLSAVAGGTGSGRPPGSHGASLPSPRLAAPGAAAAAAGALRAQNQRRPVFQPPPPWARPGSASRFPRLLQLLPCEHRP